MSLIKSINSIKFYFAKRSPKFIPQEKLIALFGGVDKEQTASFISSVLKEKFTPIFLSSKKDELLFDIYDNAPKADKLILDLDTKSSHLVSKAIDPSIYLFTHLTTLDDSQFIKKLSKDKTIIVNFDDPNLRKAVEETEAEVIFYGSSAKDCHVWASNIRISNYQCLFELNYGVERVEIRSKQLGFLSVSNMVASSALGLLLKIPLTTVKKGLEKIEPLPHHLELTQGHNGSMIIDDSYDSDASSLEDSLEVLNMLPARRRIAVIGEMKGLEGDSERIHKEIARKLYKDKVDIVITGIGDAKYITQELTELGFLDDRMDSNLQNPQIVSMLLKILSKGDLVLLKASSSAKFSEVAKKISKSGII